MLKPLKYRLYPTAEQSILLNKHIGASRFVYNLALECKRMAWVGSRVNLSCFDLQGQLVDLKAEYDWLKEVNSQSLQQSIVNLDKAYTAFFRGQNRFPVFKKKSSGGTFSVPQKVRLKNDLLVIPKFKNGIKIVLHRPIEGTIKQATIIKTPTGKYFASILCDTPEEIKPVSSIKENTTIGLDLGIKKYLVTSDGKEFDYPNFLRKEQSKLKFWQRKYSKHKGKRTKHKLAILHERVANQRKDFLHKTSSELINNHESLAIEDLAVSNMLKNHVLALSITDASWATFVSMLKYKANWRGKSIIKIGRFEPSSKTCSCCGYLNKDLGLADRSWTCPNCQSVLDRDVNAAINIKNFALKNILSGTDRKNQEELSTMVEVLTLEAKIANNIAIR